MSGPPRLSRPPTSGPPRLSRPPTSGPPRPRGGSPRLSRPPTSGPPRLSRPPTSGPPRLSRPPTRRRTTAAEAERDQARTDLKTRTEARDQLIVNFDAMVGVVRELGVDRRDFDAAARRAGLDDDDAQFLRSKVGPGRGQER